MSHFDQTIVSSRIGSPVIIIMLLLSGMMTLFTISVPPGVSGITVAGGELIGNTHWTISDSPVDILDNVTIPSGSTLTIDPGVTVTLTPSAWIEVEGTIWAQGTNAASIEFHRSHSSYNFDGINVTNGGYGYLDHIEMSGSAGGIKAQGMTTKAFVYNSTLEGNAAGFRGQSSAFAWVVNCTFNSPLNATAQSGAEVHEGKWFFFNAVDDLDWEPVEGVEVEIKGKKYPTELDEWIIFDSNIGGVTTGSDGIMSAIPVNQYKHMGSTSSVHVDVTMVWTYQNAGASWEEKLDTSMFVGDNFALEWMLDFTPPPIPTNFRVGNRTGDSIELFWDLDDPPGDLYWFTINYHLKYEVMNWPWETHPGPNDRSIVIDSLDEKAEYEFRIRSEDYHPNHKGWAVPFVTANTFDVTPPKEVVNFHFENVGPDWVRFIWDPSPSSDIIGFWLNISKKDSTWNNSYWIDGRRTLTANITELESETEYVAYIIPVDDSETPNLGNASGNVEFKTLDNTPPPIPMLEFFPMDIEQYLPGTLYFNTSLVGFKVNVTGEDRTVIEILLDGIEFVDPDGKIEKWTTYEGVFQYYFYLDEGRHNARFRSIDPSGNIGEFNLTDIWVDLTPPEMEIENVTGEEAHFFFGETVDLSLNISDLNSVHSIMWTIAGDGILEQVDGTELSLDLEVGLYHLSVIAYDIAGNWKVLTYKLNITIKDIIPPGIVSTDPIDGASEVSKGPGISISFSERILWNELVPILFPTDGESMALRFEIDEETRTITYYPEDALDGNMEYTFRLGYIFDLSGNKADDVVIHFTTIGYTDIDNDGIPDEYELDHPNVLSPSDPDDAAEDFDNDALSNLQEYLNGTEPDNPDTDEDGIPDGKEVEWGLDPTWASDAQGDLDDDDYTNLEEYEKGSNPLNANSIPEVEEESITPYIIIMVLIVILVMAVIVIFVIILLKKRKEEELREEEEKKFVEGEIEEPTWSKQEDALKKDCPFCSAILDLDMSYCPECGMTLPEEEINEESMDEDLVKESDESLPTLDDEVEQGDLIPSSPDIPEPEEDLIPTSDPDIEPPSLDDEIGY